MRTIIALCLTVVCSMAVSVAGLLATRAIVPPAFLLPSNEICGGYLQTVGTIYAVLLAFVVFVVWTQANDVRRLIERQADELADVLRITKVFKGSAGSDVLVAARAYAREVAEHEWLLLRTGQSSPRAQELLEQTWTALTAIEPETAREEVLFSEAVSRFSEFGDARADLLHCGRVRLPVLLWLLLLSGAAGTVGSMYLFGAAQFWPVAAMTASLAGAVSFMLFLIRDLDNPFQGDWHVSPALIVAATDPTDN
ncbi:MAG: DUF4239 domain-containing protein [Fuerstia sp.]|nr:DUF4239 domain-containing protein [Fuerstiella sp.]